MTRIEDAHTSESREALAKEFNDEEYRYAYSEDFLNTWIATQIITLREQRGMSQAQLGDLIGTKQPGISRLENVNHSTWKTETLKRIARALGVRLKITFETFGTLLEEDERFGRRYLERPTFEDDPRFAERESTDGARITGKVVAITEGKIRIDKATKDDDVTKKPATSDGFSFPQAMSATGGMING